MIEADEAEALLNWIDKAEKSIDALTKTVEGNTLRIVQLQDLLRTAVAAGAGTDQRVQAIHQDVRSLAKRVVQLEIGR